MSPELKLATTVSQQIVDMMREARLHMDDFEDRLTSYDGTTGVIDIGVLNTCLQEALALLAAARRL